MSDYYPTEDEFSDEDENGGKKQKLHSQREKVIIFICIFIGE